MDKTKDLKKRVTKVDERLQGNPSLLRSESEGVQLETFTNGKCALWKITVLVFSVRLFNALTLKTFFQADEYYQALEPAYHLVFKYGYLTWEWKEQIRSSLHPLIYAVGYYIALYFDSAYLVKLMPKLTGATIATVGEVSLYIFCRSYTHNELLSQLTLALSLTNSFNWYVITRSFSNSLEMLLTAFALAMWHYDASANARLNYRHLSFGCIAAYFACIVRPTNILIWVVAGPYLLFLVYQNTCSFGEVTKVCLFLVSRLVLVLGISTLLDYLFYGVWTFPLYNFIEFNIVRGLSIFYGSAPWSFYLVQAIPLLLTGYLPWFIFGMLHEIYMHSLLGAIVCATITGFSLISHKEFRFIYPLQPILLLIAATSMLYKYRTYPRLHKRFFIPIALVLNVVLAFYFSQIHERGEIEVIDDLSSDPTVLSIGILAPCHSTPWTSHMHNSPLYEKSWFITCEPPLHLESSTNAAISAYKDESDLLYDDISKFIVQAFPPLRRELKPGSGLFADLSESENKYYRQWPSHLVFFEHLRPKMQEILIDSPYVLYKTYFNSHFHWDPRRSGRIYVYRWDNNDGEARR